jgi:hypothetical protein
MLQGNVSPQAPAQLNSGIKGKTAGTGVTQEHMIHCLRKLSLTERGKANIAQI